jgi:hypothetical protein
MRHLDLSDGRRRLNVRAYMDDIISRGNNWFMKEVKKLDMLDKRMGYLVLRNKIEEMAEILKLGYHSPLMPPEDKVFFTPDNLDDFDLFYAHFFDEKNVGRPNSDIWTFKVDVGIESWMKFNFLMGVHIMDLEKYDIIPIISLYENDLGHVTLMDLIEKYPNV